MPTVIIPTPDQPIGTGKCVHCGQEYEVKINPTWYQQLIRWIKQTNTNTSDLNP